MISMEGLALIGLDRHGALYLDGERLYTERRLAGPERVIAWIAAAAAVLAASSTAVQAWKAIYPSPIPEKAKAAAPAPPHLPYVLTR